MSARRNLAECSMSYAARIAAYIAYQDGRARDAKVPLEERMAYARRVKRCKQFRKAIDDFIRDLGQQEA